MKTAFPNEKDVPPGKGTEEPAPAVRDINSLEAKVNRPFVENADLFEQKPDKVEMDVIVEKVRKNLRRKLVKKN